MGRGAEEWTDYRLTEAGWEWGLGGGGLLSVATVLENQHGDVHTFTQVEQMLTVVQLLIILSNCLCAD